jgi:glycosyltransferase XagB
VGGTILSGLIYPFLVLPFIGWLVTRTSELQKFFPPAILFVSLANLIVGNSCLIYLSMLAVAKRRHHSLLPQAGFWQLLRNPFYWEKTVHGISKFTDAEIARVSSKH